MTKKQKELEKKLMHQLNIDDLAILKEWETNRYLADSKTVLDLWKLIEEASYVRIIGDYDCDGVCASYIMSKAIRNVYPNKKVSIRIPKRLSEGYGINKTIVEEIKRDLPKESLIITVDNGIAASEILEDLKENGYKVVVTDHHELGKNKIPEVDMVLNPKLPNAVFQGDYWCGAAVAYKLCEMMIAPSLAKELEIFAGIATVGDCMPLTAGNHGLVKRTMEAIKMGNCPQSITNLLKQLKQSPENLSETSLSFYICPAINASGRLFDDGAKKPLSYFLKPTMEKCEELVEINEKRKKLRDDNLELAKKIITEQHMENDCPIWVKVPNVHEGIIGILAGNLTEEYGVPVIVLTESKTPNILKGSARTTGGIDIFQYLQSCGDIYERMGGHPGAAGLSIKEENLKIARTHQVEKPRLTNYTNYILMDIEKEEIPDMAFVSEKFRPFGEGNIPPLFHINVDLTNSNARYLGNPPIHLCLQDALNQYKIMHFYHKEYDLQDENHFGLTGEIKYETYMEKITPTMFAKTINETVYSKEKDTLDTEKA